MEWRPCGVIGSDAGRYHGKLNGAVFLVERTRSGRWFWAMRASPVDYDSPDHQDMGAIVNELTEFLETLGLKGETDGE